MSTVGSQNLFIQMISQIQNHLTTLAKNIAIPGNLTIDQPATGESEASNGKEKGNKAAAEKNGGKNQTKLGDSQSNKMVRETHQGQRFEKLVKEGHKEKTPVNENKRQGNATEAKGEEEAKQNLKAINHPVIAPNTELDKRYLKEKLETEEKYESQEEDADDDNEEEEEESLEEGEENLSLKETDPGYYVSLLIKI